MEDFQAETFITDRIPHRPPFLWLDRVLELTDDSIRAEKQFPRTWMFSGATIPIIPSCPASCSANRYFRPGRC